MLAVTTTLGGFDAVGFAQASRVDWVSIADVIEAAISWIEAINPTLGGLAYCRVFTQARPTALNTVGRFFSGVHTCIKDSIDVTEQRTMWGSDAWVPQNAFDDCEFTRLYLVTGLVLLGKTQLSEFGFSASVEHLSLMSCGTPTAPPVPHLR